MVTAKVLTHKETLIFDPEHETRGVRYDGEPIEEATCEEVRCFEVVEKPEKSATVTAPKPSVLPATSHSRYFKQLSTIETSEKAAIKVEKESLPQKSKNESPSQDTKDQNRLFQWLHRIRKKNKDGPPDTPRE